MKVSIMKKNRPLKNTEAHKSKEKEDREARINYTLDMVVHDLVSHGHLQPAKSYLLKTAEMKEHIGRMCDQLNRRKKQEEMTKSSRIIPKSNSTSTNSKSNPKTLGDLTYNITSSTMLQQVRNQSDNNNMAHKKDIYVNEYSTNVLTEKNNSVFSSHSAHLPATHFQHSQTNKTPNSNHNHPYTHRQENKKIDPWMSPRDITDEKPIAQTDHSKPIHYNTSTKLSFQHNVAQAQAYRAKIDMSGFANDEISLDMDGRRLIITASRPKKVQQNARKVTEYIDIPEGVNLENLKIGRRLDGSLLIEEFVPGVD